MLLASLVSIRQFEEVDQFLSKLPKDHCIFSLPEKQIENIVYGMSKTKYRVIRVSSLYHLLTPKTNIDPFNSYLLGKYAVKQYLRQGYNIYDIPFITQITNRYINTKHMELLLENPKNFDSFCDDKHYDHFPLFQFTPHQQEITVQKPYKSISFWFKFDGVSSSPVVFFRNNYIVLGAENNDIVVIIDKKKFNVSCDSTKWNIVVISLKDSFRSSTINVYVSGNNFQNTVNSTEIFSTSKFTNDSEHLFFVGSAIRFFNKTFPEPNDIQSKGPGYIDLLNEDFIITPYNVTQKSKDYITYNSSSCL